MSNTLSVLILFVILFIFFRYGIRSSATKHEDDMDTDDYAIVEISVQLDNVNGIMERIKSIENFITDIEICEPGEYEKNITLQWFDKKCGNQNYDFWINGNNLNTELILQIAYAERQKLRTLLKKEINILNENSNDSFDMKG